MHASKLSYKKTVATGAAVSLIAAFFVGGGVANAATPADINPNKTGSIIVHKHAETANAGTVSNGQVAQPAGAPISGVTFTAQKINNVNLATSAGWTALNTLTPTAAANQVTGAVYTKVTGVNGEATFGNLPVGAYLVKETAKPANILGEVAPFIVTIPHPTANNGQWIYDVNVYPKNSVTTEPTKTVNNTAVKAGDDINWTITQVLPFLPAGEQHNTVTVTDTLVGNLQYKNATVTVNGQPATQGVTVNAQGQLVTITLDRRQGAQLNGGDTIKVELVTTLVSGGEIKNTANVAIDSTTGTINKDTPTPPSPEDPSSPPTPGDSAPPVVHFAYFNVNKIAAGSTTGLNGAQFELYTGSNCEVQNKVDIDAATLTTTSTGAFAAPQLVRAGNYSLKEIKAPLGYVLPSGSAACTNFSATISNDNSVTAPKVVDVENEKAAVPGLPLTGAQGQMLLIAAGGVLILAGIIAVVAMRRRQTEEAK